SNGAQSSLRLNHPKRGARLADDGTPSMPRTEGSSTPKAAEGPAEATVLAPVSGGGDLARIRSAPPPLAGGSGPKNAVGGLADRVRSSGDEANQRPEALGRDGTDEVEA